ncbi:MAG: UDP-N-acetylmuramoyl-tripeptide--D-alanyl-D-alanine ligase [Flavobacteriales bacterium]|nr:UDP-N-acetylmuramoyl-tripeptide--D-alanyl-D-alanine ligase [Flavobacteriales bacterium]
MVSIQALYAAFRQSAGACTDTRQLLPGGMFFALKGPNFNANTFAMEALRQGCAFAVVDEPSSAVDERCLLVPDVLTALQALARHHRRQHSIPVIAITGTNGKTTTKELLHAVLSAHAPTLATSGNLNNHIGVPLTLLRMTEEHRFAIIEMGANHVGDIAELVNIAEPTHGAITNIGRAHLEGFGSYEGVIKAKTEMYTYINRQHGLLFVNADDALLMKESTGISRRTYGLSQGSDVRVLDRGSSAYMGIGWTDASGGTIESITKLVGAYNLPNAALAVAVGRYFGVPDLTIKDALTGYVPSNNRSQFMDTGRNHVIMDAYNANPSSMKAALENFAAMGSDRPKLAVLGGMKELGAESRVEHERIIALVADLGLEAIYVGPEFMELMADRDNVYANAEAASTTLSARNLQGALILVKGSRGTRLESLAPAF